MSNDPRMEKSLKGFHHRAVRRMADLLPKHQWHGTLLYPPIGAALATVGLDEIGVYIARRQNTAAKYIANNTIMEFCLKVNQDKVLQMSRWWW